MRCVMGMGHGAMQSVGAGTQTDDVARVGTEGMAQQRHTHRCGSSSEQFVRSERQGAHSPANVNGTHVMQHTA